MRKEYKYKKGKSSVKTWNNTFIAGILSAAVCVGLLSFSTYAMFTADVSTKPSVVATADYKMSLVVEGGSVSIAHEGEKLRYDLSAGTYEVTLQASGTSSTGFAMFQLNGISYYGAQLAPTERMTFTLTCEAETVFEYDYQWGRHGRTENVISDGNTLTVTI